MPWKGNAGVYIQLYFIVVMNGEHDKRNRCSPTVISCVPSCCELASLFKCQSESHQSKFKPGTWTYISVLNVTPQTMRWVMFHLQASFAFWEYTGIGHFCHAMGNSLETLSQQVYCVFGFFLQPSINWGLQQQVEEEVSPSGPSLLPNHFLS